MLIEPWAGETLHSSKLSSPIRNTTFHDTHTLPIYIILTPHHFYLDKPSSNISTIYLLVMSHDHGHVTSLY